MRLLLPVLGKLQTKIMLRQSTQRIFKILMMQQ